MDDSTSGSYDSASRFWDKYIDLLLNHGVKESVRRWYVRRIEQYIEFYSDERLRTHTKNHLDEYFTHLGREETLSDWQFRQSVDAIRILFCALLKSDSCSEVDWDYWSEASVGLATGHDTIAREAVAVDIPDKNLSESPTVDVRVRFPEELGSLTTRIRTLGYSIRTEKSYVQWVVRFLARQPYDDLAELDAQDVRDYLDYLVVHRNVSASTQSQALNALLFFFKNVLERDFGELGDFVRSKRAKRLPTVLSPQEVNAMLIELKGVHYVMAALLYGTGMRLMECIRLRVQDIDFSYHQIHVRNGKGKKDRVVPLPHKLEQPLREQL
ncbi:MAG TPA: integron integrase, partial [Thermodesulforhabdus norvegica]|nr:integron integrase [Thermodesulforhabdus norvegica]